MESPQFSTLSLLTLLFLLLLVKKLLNKKNNSMIASHKLPPGPWKLPIIGSMHHLITEHPNRKLHSLAMKYGPLLHLKLGEINLMVITSIELAREVMKTHDINFASRPKIMASKIIFYDSTDIGFAPYGKYWLQMRKICSLELLGAKRVKSFSFIREEEGNNIVKKICMARGSPVNLSDLFLMMTNKTVARAAFGKECAHQKKFLLVMKEAIKCTSGFYLAELFPSLSFLSRVSGLKLRMERVHQILDEILNEIIEEHQAKKISSVEGMDNREDVVDVLLRVQRQGELNISLTMDNIKAVILDLFMAGTHTTSTTLEWAMTEIIRHPKVMQKAQSEVRMAFAGKSQVEEKDINKLNYLNQIIKETLRLHPVAPLLMQRICHETIELFGYTIPAGSTVVINAGAIMKDPKIWDEPESFQPERFEGNAMDFKGDNLEYIPFGAGRRICPGIAFAKVGIELLLAQLLFHFDWELPDGRRMEELDVDEVFGITVTRKNNLRVIATPHM